jgi:hypothetical protein
MPYADPEKQRAYQLKWVRAREQQGVQMLGGACARCGARENLRVAHRLPNDLDPVLYLTGRSSMWSWSWDRIKAELHRCLVLCTPCLEKRKPAWEYATHARQRYCIHGHDTWHTGRDAKRRCRQCRREREYPRKRKTGKPQIILVA